MDWIDPRNKAYGLNYSNIADKAGIYAGQYHGTLYA